MAGQLSGMLGWGCCNTGPDPRLSTVCFILTLQVSVGSQWLPPMTETSQKTSSKSSPSGMPKCRGRRVQKPLPEPTPCSTPPLG